MSKVDSRYCTIMDYLQDKHKTVYEVIKALCLERMLNPRKNGGMTFLIPDKDHLANLVKLTNDDDRMLEADHIIKSLVLYEYAPDLSSLASKKLANRNGQLVEFKGSSSKIETANGCAISAVKDFKIANKQVNVFLLSGGSLPLTGDEAPRGGPKGGKKIKYGGSEMKTCQKELCQSSKKMLAEYNRDRLNKTRRNTYLECMASYLDQLKNSTSDADKKAYQIVLSTLDVRPEVAWYLMVEQDMADDNRILKDVEKKGCLANKSVSHYKEHLATYAASGLLSSESGKKQLHDAVSSVRRKILNSTGIASLAGAIKEVYQNLETKNTIELGGKVYASGVYGEDVFEHLKSGKKMWQDEIRFIFGRHLADYWSEFPLDAAEDLEHMQFVLDCYCGKDCAKECKLNSQEFINSRNVSSKDLYESLYKAFVESDDFLYFPCGCQESENLKAQMTRLEKFTESENQNLSQVLGGLLKGLGISGGKIEELLKDY